MRAKKIDFNSITNTLEEVKLQYHQLQKMNDLERAEMQREQKIAAMFKFTKMAKKQPFLPSLHTRGFLQIENAVSIDNGLPYLPAREKDALMFPKRTTDFSKLFTPTRTSDCGDYFTKPAPVGQEFDQYDEVLRKYMTSRERGI